MIIRRWCLVVYTPDRDWKEMAALANALEQTFLLRSSAMRTMRRYDRMFEGLPLEFGVKDRRKQR